jgi:hypothetical protein
MWLPVAEARAEHRRDARVEERREDLRQHLGRERGADRQDHGNVDPGAQRVLERGLLQRAVAGGIGERDDVERRRGRRHGRQDLGVAEHARARELGAQLGHDRVQRVGGGRRAAARDAEHPDAQLARHEQASVLLGADEVGGRGRAHFVVNLLDRPSRLPSIFQT